jgi:lysophospholipase L1-like esterase
MKRILCYGDSNTHGTKPMRGPNDVARFTFSERWPGIVASELGSDYEIIEEGLPGRTTVHDDPIEGDHKNGKTYLLPCLESHWPLDAVVIALGVNDLKIRHGVSAFDIAAGVGVLIDVVRSAPSFGHETPKLLVLSPPSIIETGWLAKMFAGGAEKSKALSAELSAIAHAKQVAFLNLNPVAQVSPLDGIHFDATNHHAMGHAIALQLKALLA